METGDFKSSTDCIEPGGDNSIDEGLGAIAAEANDVQEEVNDV